MDNDKFFKEYHKYIRALVIKFSKNSRNYDDIEDIIQGANEKFLKGALGKFREESKITTYIYRVVYNHWVDCIKEKIKRERNEVYSDTILNWGNIPSSYNEDNIEKREIILETINFINPDLKKVIGKLSIIKDRKQADIAGILQIAQSTVSKNIASAEKILKQEIIKKYPDLRDKI